MRWTNFFYFSKGERRALTLLLFIIATALVLLVCKEYYVSQRPEPETAEVMQNVAVQDTASEKADTVAMKSAKAIKQRASVKKKFSPKPRFNKSASTFSQKYAKGTVVELNTADTLVLKKVPGIGSSFARRIVGYRELLGGYSDVEQLREVYGVDDEKFDALQPWFDADRSRIRKVPVNHLSIEKLARHPYLSYKQARAIVTLRERKGALTGWENLDLLEEFTDNEKEKLSHYLSFE